MGETHTERNLFILDTNVLMHDPTALFRFAEHDIFIPMIVLEELDAAKKGLSEVSRNVRQTNRFIAELIDGLSNEEIASGIELYKTTFRNGRNSTPSGKLFLQTNDMDTDLPSTLAGNKNDNTILASAKGIQTNYPDRKVSIVSKDINLRIKASALGIPAEDYHHDLVLDDVSLLHKGHFELPADFWEQHSKDMHSWQDEGRTFYQIKGPLIKNWYASDCIFTDESADDFSAIVRETDDEEALIEVLNDHTQPRNAVWGITARNREQNLALNLLLDPEIDFVTLTGVAGTGKTLLALASGLHQTIEKNLYREIIMTRVTVPLGDDIGFLPGTEEEKMTPWMGALLDNLEVLNCSEDKDDWQRAATHDLVSNRVKIRSLNFMRGRTFLNKYIIIDEAQNLTPKQMKALVTRGGPGTKIICIGDIQQIDTPYLTEASSGLTYAVDNFKSWKHSGHMSLRRSERSRLAEFAAEAL